ncbi:MucR family transcriptional regulator [Methylorubrum populi]|jgi:predicted transcriptional regulator|uniref:MucR family transcriptional regulator n=1 Tax=Methylorubrum rhodesianum TaxID=29427 RepID=A0ABU9Z7T4_9HYPH|nr:MucR family transcriptional regulator [Methylorubrum rhodesianum]MBK3402884.1 MucR family transcriptional regulator [Methylorubrum rhodesianum]MBY0143085.1 MucR family transcriptional regulator [Methylorubrum populi]
MINENTDNVAATEADIVDHTITIVVAYVAKNTLPPRDLPNLVVGVHAALARLGSIEEPATVEEKIEKPTPAQIRKSIMPEALISFIDGKPYNMLKRHLKKHGLDPSGYRERYGLPKDYPMTAPSYSERRSELAKANGLGRPFAGGDERTKAAK